MVPYTLFRNDPLYDAVIEGMKIDKAFADQIIILHNHHKIFLKHRNCMHFTDEVLDAFYAHKQRMEISDANKKQIADMKKFFRGILPDIIPVCFLLYVVYYMMTK